MKLVTLRQASDLLGVKIATLRKWIYLRKIEFVKLSPRAIRISDKEIERIIASGTFKSIPEA